MTKVKLGEVADILSGYAFKSTQFNTEKRGLPLIRIRDVERGFSDTYFEGDFAEEYLVHNGDLLITMDGSFILKKWAGGEALLNQRVCKLIIRDNRVEEDYISWIVPKYLKEIEDKTPFVTVKHLSVAKIHEISFELPHRSEQLVISNQLNNIKDIYNLRLQQLSKLSDLVKSRFYEMFGDIQQQEKYKGIVLKELCNTMSGGTPSTKILDYYRGDIPWITTVSLGENYIDGTNSKGFITQEAIHNSSTKLIPAKNILFGTRVGVGKSSINTVDICINQDIVAIIDIDKSKFNLLLIKYVLDSYKPYYDSIKKGATILGITTEDLQSILVPNAPIDIQNQFADFVAEVDKSQLAGQMVLKLWRKLLKFSIIKLSFYEK